MDEAVISALALTLRVASLATLCALIPGIPLAYALARFDFPLKGLVSTLVSLPLVLPPTAVGYLLLRVLGVRGLLGRDTLGFDLGILLTWKAAVLAATVMAMPLVVRTVRVAFEGIDPRLEQMARTLGYSPSRAFVLITLPLATRGLLAAALLGFTRAVGEFGATVILAGNIPGKTQTLASAIFSAQQVGAQREAALLLTVALIVGFVAVFASERLVGAAGRSANSSVRIIPRLGRSKR